MSDCQFEALILTSDSYDTVFGIRSVRLAETYFPLETLMISPSSIIRFSVLLTICSLMSVWAAISVVQSVLTLS